jgi:uncharacterized membrane protein
MNRHNAAKDLSLDILAAPHTPEVLDRYPQVGILKEEKGGERQIPAFLAQLLKQFPFLKRHPHPMTVHFPIVYTFTVMLFTVLYLITGIRGFEVTALHCLGAGILFTPVAIATGYFTWWLNYYAKPLRPVRIKIPLAFTIWIISVIIFSWRIAVPDILQTAGPSHMIYLLLVFSLIPIITIIGWFGATMTFPIDEE